MKRICAAAIAALFAATPAFAQDWRIYRDRTPGNESAWAYDRDSIQARDDGTTVVYRAIWTAAEHKTDAGKPYHTAAGPASFDCTHKQVKIRDMIFYDSDGNAAGSSLASDAGWAPFDANAPGTGIGALAGMICENKPVPDGADDGGTMGTVFKRMNGTYSPDHSL